MPRDDNAPVGAGSQLPTQNEFKGWIRRVERLTDNDHDAFDDFTRLIQQTDVLYSRLAELEKENEEIAEEICSEIEGLPRYDAVTEYCCSECTPSASMEASSWGEYVRRADVLALFTEPSEASEVTK